MHRNPGGVMSQIYVRQEVTVEAANRLSAHLKTRLLDLSQVKREGRKIIGYTPGGYLPEELVLLGVFGAALLAKAELDT